MPYSYHFLSELQRGISVSIRMASQATICLCMMLLCGTTPVHNDLQSLKELF